MRFDSMVVSSDREDNQVDKLLKQISQIRDNCQHEFKIKKPFDLQESKVSGVYIVGAEGNFRKITIVCVKCSKENEVSLATFCPACLGYIKTDARDPLRRSEYYPDGKFQYYGAVHGHCSKCDLKVVWDEWDQ